MCRGSSGCSARRSMSTNAVRKTGLATSATIVAGAVQEWVSALENPYTSANRPSAEVTAPGMSIGSRSGVAWLISRRNADDRGRHGDHEVDVQAPAPGQDLRQGTAEDEAERGAAAGDRAEDPERLGPVGRSGERDRQQRQRRGREQRTERPLQRASGHEHAEGLGQSADRRGQREPGQPGDQGPFAPEQITELAAQQQQAAERQRVGGDDPLPAVGRETQLLLGRRDRDGDDRRVEHHHQLRDAEQSENRPSIRFGGRGLAGRPTDGSHSSMVGDERRRLPAEPRRGDRA